MTEALGDEAQRLLDLVIDGGGTRILGIAELIDRDIHVRQLATTFRGDVFIEGRPTTVDALRKSTTLMTQDEGSRYVGDLKWEKE